MFTWLDEHQLSQGKGSWEEPQPLGPSRQLCPDKTRKH